MDEKADPMLGRVLDGRYRIDRRIARGGMAMVYEGTDLRLDRLVAIKVMHEPLADDPTFVVRFEREARSAAKLSHPNAVSVFDQGEDHGTLFLIMEYVPGVTLRDLIRREAPLPPALALRVIESVLGALNAAHAIGIVHRDIKPENVLLATGDLNTMDPRHTKVADFGLARAINAETQHTATGGVIIGTVSYLAPEMLVSGTADARVDVYAAGVLLYELLTGAKPHQADNPIQVAYKHVHEDIGKPSHLVRGLPPYVDALVARATARDVNQRPTDAGVLLHHVQRVRQALEAGVIDDPDLTADLLPSVHSTSEDTAAQAVPEWDDVYPDVQPDYEPTAQLNAVPPILPTASSTSRAPIPVQPVLRTRQPRRRRRLAIVIVALIALVLGLGGGGWYYFVERYTHTPALLNLSETAAMQRLEKAELHGKVTQRVYSAIVPKGEVVSSNPASRARVLKHSTVGLVISLGKPVVPKLAGLTQAAATAKIKAVHLTLGAVTQDYNDTVKSGIVISSTPESGISLAPDQAVSLIISKGPAPVDIPDFKGKPEKSSVKALKALGLKVVVDKRVNNDNVAKDDIISQSPAGTTGHRGDTIHLTVSKGPKMGTVPNGLRGMSIASAKAKLAAAGFTNVVIDEPLGYVALGLVASVSPGSGTSWPLSKAVTLRVV